MYSCEFSAFSFTVAFDQFNVSLLNVSILLFYSTDQKPLKYYYI